ncbi:ArgP/LysG family DNA-binding transcriptional regulator [Microbulbifer sp. A4B17]|uniref:LysR family transcriptional regulator ArgP n=1 Tax=Microbulbifer sp. A4B17 TaxID=359370 RepID=UPI000D52C2EA|nr:LysR family transcriptional regulator ArgP [Microbulbifer sp. A4B17]AWF80255.1 ArgP/LysG family DNA-binding transcriptional regulator [Microbulbifer sp. A4B17]
MLDLKQLQAFAFVVEERSFDKAAALLHVSQSAISQRIKSLESQVGQALLIRSNPLRPTEAGLKVLGYYQQMHLLQQELLTDIDPEGGKTRYSNQNKVRIALNSDSLDTWFLSAITPLIRSQQLLVDLKVDDQEATHELLKNGEVIGCISSTTSNLQGCQSVLLGHMAYYPVCTRSFKKKFFSDPIHVDEFRYAPAVEFNYKDRLQSRYLKKFWGVETGQYPSHEIPSSKSFLSFLTLGLGWGMAPDIQVASLLKSGKLVKLAEDQCLEIPLYWHVWNLKSKLIKQITINLTEQAQKALQQS